VSTGTIYALVDPRDGKLRYIGQTKKQPFSARLGGSYAPRVRAWMAEVRAAGLAPLIVAVRENVPADGLRTAESEEITRIVAAGGALLNEQATAIGEELNRQRLDAERKAAERAGWAELADVALAALGGPLPPGDLPDGGWLDMRRLGGDLFSSRMDCNISRAAEIPYASREDASRCRGLIMWYMVAVDPWWHLAEIAGRPQDDAAFIAWAGRDAGTREALKFLAAHGNGLLARLSAEWEDWRYKWQVFGPGRLLGVIAAAYTGAVPADGICPDVADVLRKAAEDHMLTRPMADLLMRLDPRALDAVFGKDIAVELDRDLELPPGTSGRVLQALAGRLSLGPRDRVQRIADRSAQALPLTALPDYRGWSGPMVPAARVAAASLVRAGLAEPDGITPENYLAEVRALWTPCPAYPADAAA
jgi:hypothetical protein